MGINAAFQGAQQRGLAVVATAHDDGKPLRDTHARDGAAAGEIKGVCERLWGFERRGLRGGKRAVAIACSAREDRAVADESDELAGCQLGAQELLIAQQGHVILEGAGVGRVKTVVEQAVVGELRQVIGQKVGGLAAQDAAALGRQTNKQAGFDAVGSDQDVSAFQHLLADITDVNVLRAGDIGFDAAG